MFSINNIVSSLINSKQKVIYNYSLISDAWIVVWIWTLPSPSPTGSWFECCSLSWWHCYRTFRKQGLPPGSRPFEVGLWKLQPGPQMWNISSACFCCYKPIYTLSSTVARHPPKPWAKINPSVPDTAAQVWPQLFNGWNLKLFKITNSVL